MSMTGTCQKHNKQLDVCIVVEEVFLNEDRLLVTDSGQVSLTYINIYLVNSNSYI